MNRGKDIHQRIRFLDIKNKAKKECFIATPYMDLHEKKDLVFVQLLFF